MAFRALLRARNHCDHGDGRERETADLIKIITHHTSTPAERRAIEARELAALEEARRRAEAEARHRAAEAEARRRAEALRADARRAEEARLADARRADEHRFNVVVFNSGFPIVSLEKVDFSTMVAELVKNTPFVQACMTKYRGVTSSFRMMCEDLMASSTRDKIIHVHEHISIRFY